MPTAEELRTKLQSCALEPVIVEVADTSDGCGSKFEAIVVSTKFEGMPLLERQRAVNEVISEEMQTIHAFSLKTWTPDQHAKKTAAATT